jgi:hypothetical protein
MSLADHEIEEPSEDELFCPIHMKMYWDGSGCDACKDDEMDRRFDGRSD